MAGFSERITFPTHRRSDLLTLPVQDKPGYTATYDPGTNQIKFDPPLHRHVDARTWWDKVRTSGAGFMGIPY